jgi:hypothetical protein
MICTVVSIIKRTRSNQGTLLLRRTSVSSISCSWRGTIIIIIIVIIIIIIIITNIYKYNTHKK